jgi:hypothetical protein
MPDENPTLSILREPCDQCPFKNRLTGGLRPGRLKDIMDTAEKDQTYFSCHKTIDYELPESKRGDAVFQGASVCAGWLEAARKARRVPSIIHVAERLGLVSYRKVPE